MAARDRFEITVKCPKCGVSGTAQVSEDDYPFMRSPGFAVDGLPSGFVETKYAERRQETEVMCTKCKVPFYL
jgi:RecJ-like exonuclease